ncbi:MAG: FHA domain-containing protein [Pyrinomonadaceae bacterium]
MIRCHKCQTPNLDTSRFCDQCGLKLIQPQADSGVVVADYAPPSVERASMISTNSGSVSAPSMAVEILENLPDAESVQATKPAHATLVIERGGTPGTEFSLTNDESTIGRWDADNGIFPDIDLDTHDDDAKVSRRHARIRRNNGSYFIEDLGSTNGTYVNRGRRLLPGNTQLLKDGDEVIVGKTFLRFLVNH